VNHQTAERISLATPALVPAAEIETRMRAFQRGLRENGFAGALIVQATDLYYLTGTAQDAHLVVPASGEPALHVRRSLERARAESALERIVPMRSLSALPEALKELGLEQGRLGLELDVLPASRYLAYLRLLAPLELADCSNLLRNLRAQKSSWEQEQIGAAGAMAAAVVATVPSLLAAGMTELELAAELERVLRRLGHQGLLRFRGFNQETFYGIIAAGESAAAAGGSDAPVTGVGPSVAAPKGASHRPIREHEPVVIDLFGIWNGYLADQTRMFSIGRLAPRFHEAYELSLAIEQSLARSLRPGVRCSSLYDHAVALAQGHEGFMGAGDQRVSFVGHGVGLEIDEPPFLARSVDNELREGMVVAIEPKFVFAGECALGIENTYVVSEDGGVAVTTAPTELVEL
jgi:Xaa-Pro dipeptidase